MKTKDFYDFYLKKYSNLNIPNEKINLDFDYLCTDLEFKKEFKRFLRFIQHFFIQDGILLTVFNSYCYPLDKEVPYFFNLFEKSKNIKESIYSQFIAEYLISYFRSLKSLKYKNEIINIKKYENKLFSYFQKNDFFEKGDIYNKSLQFYIRLTEYTKKSKILIFDDKIQIILKNIGVKNSMGYKKIFANILANERFLDKLILFDFSIDEHLEQYEQFINNNFDIKYNGERTLNLILKLNKESKLKEEVLSNYFNKLIDTLNRIINKCKNREDHILQNLTDIDDSIMILNSLKQVNYKNFKKDFKSKIGECTLKLLNIKRVITGDNNYVMRDMQENLLEIEVDNRIDRIVNDITKNIINLYGYLRIDFDKEVERSINLFSDHPLSKIVTTFSIDDKKQTYKKNQNVRQSEYKKYYDQLGKEIIQKEVNTLTNILNKDYYEAMLQDCNNFLYSSISLLVVQSADRYDEILLVVKNNLKYTDPIFNNDYILISDLIIKLEYEIFKIANQIEIDNISDLEKNLEFLFNYYKDNELYRNGLMMVNYYLYEHNGISLRNKFMHGEMLSKSLKEEKLIVFSCYLFLIYMRSMISKDEK